MQSLPSIEKFTAPAVLTLDGPFITHFGSAAAISENQGASELSDDVEQCDNFKNKKETPSAGRHEAWLWSGDGEGGCLPTKSKHFLPPPQV